MKQGQRQMQAARRRLVLRSGAWALLAAVLATGPVALGGALAETSAVAASAPAPAPGSSEAEAEATRLATELMPRLKAFIAALEPDARAAGISARTFDRALANATIDPTIPPLLVSQPEHVLAPWDYLGRLVSETRIANGRRMLAEHRATLDEVEARHGADRHVVVAIWGVESSFGALPGTRSVVRSLATLAVADPRRPAFWRAELLAALKVLERGDISPERMTGSWAGAMGHTQFMPSSYLAHAVDHDGDGRRDIWQSVPDALASTAAYLKRAGWVAGEPWGLEVVLPAGFDWRLGEPGVARAPEVWAGAGLTPPFGAGWPTGLGQSALLLPAGWHGPAVLAGANFRAILKYNNAVAYALAVGHLADRLAGRPPLAALWPIDDPPLGRAERRELQALLAGLGHDVGAVDGVIGEKTRAAVRAWQAERGLAPDGWPGTRLLGLIRAGGGQGR